jgi:hypothetical protein
MLSMESVRRRYNFHTQGTEALGERVLVTGQVARWVGKWVWKRVEKKCY